MSPARAMRLNDTYANDASSIGRLLGEVDRLRWPGLCVKLGGVGRAHRLGSDRKDRRMSANSTTKALAVSVVASAITSTLVVWLFAQRSSPPTPSGPVSQSTDSAVEFLQQVQTLRARIDQVDRQIETVATSLAEVREASRALEVAADSDSAPEVAGAHGNRANEPATVETQLRTAAEDFEFLGGLGIGAFNHPRAQQLIDKLRALGPEAYGLVIDELNHEDQDRRFAAAAVAEGLKDPALVEPLERSAIEDESFLVRRMSSHALAFLGDQAAGDSLVRVIENETRDAGVLVNSWYGLATLERPEAVTTFARVLDHAGGDLPADFVIDTALKIPDRDERLLGALELALGRSSVSLPMKSRVLSTLARSTSSAARQVIQRVADDENAPTELRNQALQILAGG